MKDRQFMVILGLVVAAGLVMGLIAFRMTGAAGPATAVASTANAGAPNSNAQSAWAADGSSATEPQPAETEPHVGEQKPPPYNPPEMQGATDGDPPGPPPETSSEISQ